MTHSSNHSLLRLSETPMEKCRCLCLIRFTGCMAGFVKSNHFMQYYRFSAPAARPVFKTSMTGGNGTIITFLSMLAVCMIMGPICFLLNALYFRNLWNKAVSFVLKGVKRSKTQNQKWMVKSKSYYDAMKLLLVLGVLCGSIMIVVDNHCIFVKSSFQIKVSFNKPWLACFIK